ncbi:MAG: hypothetical protein HYW22_01415 [Candidatus Aenigmarchaeota archaeon]|nr:hypothetical protein [Candidatus Aenigmarchaeota archaeon]
MPTDYRPSLREIASEMRRELVESGPVRFTGMFLGLNVALITGPYAIPSVVRMSREPEPTQTKRYFRPSENAGGITGVITGMGLDALVVYGYFNDPKYLAIPAATNALSALYEWGRHARGRLIERSTEIRRSTRVA